MKLYAVITHNQSVNTFFFFFGKYLFYFQRKKKKLTILFRSVYAFFVLFFCVYLFTVLHTIHTVLVYAVMHTYELWIYSIRFL